MVAQRAPPSSSTPWAAKAAASRCGPPSRGFGPILLSKVLGLNETQESSLGLVFHFADQAGLPLLDFADLVAVLKYLDSDEGKPTLKQVGGGSAHRPSA